jgi:transcriptional regulator with PAS, ATPase and Fis domain
LNINQVKQRFGIIGRSEKLDRALYAAIKVASTDLAVFIQGESGVGKEVFSRLIHELSKRKHNNFIAINCGAIPEGTINSELFGHEKGAFTGAIGERKGYFETVDGGTIFLDEIGEMPLDTQSYLLRVLESGEFIRVGSSKVLTTDVRVIAATNVKLESAIRNGKFREDLYYRLSTVPIEVPPLRDRKEDIYMIFRRFAVDFAEKYYTDTLQIDDQARFLLENYSWPGNIRELKNVVEKISVLAESKMLGAEELIKLMPQIKNRNLPAFHSEKQDSQFQEREILYKFLLDMKSDLNDLKSLVYNLIHTNNLNVPDRGALRALKAPEYENEFISRYENQNEFETSVDFENYQSHKLQDDMPIILSKKDISNYSSTEVVEEDLSLEKMEKDLINKALKKNQGKRKDAASELGISERTLYRKIKEYNLEP